MLSTFSHFFARCRPDRPSVLGLMTLLVCLVASGPGGFAAVATTPAPLAMEDGFTRESLAEFNAPVEPPPHAAIASGSIQTSADARSARAALRRRRRAARRLAAQKPPPPTVVVRSAPRRNPVEKFVYWWNGWVIRNFHTKFGTVLLGSVGAET